MEANCFTHVLMTKDQGFLHFSFDCIISPHKKKYHVTVLKRGGENFHFLMEQKHGRWKIIEAPQPPRWVKGMEHQIEEMICEHQDLNE